MRQKRYLTLLLLIVLLAGLRAPAAPAAHAQAPQGFEDRLITQVPSPTALAFLPDQRLLISSQDGRLWINASPTGSGATTSSVALDLRGRICSDFERGLLGVAVDPQFSSSPFIYLYYTFRKNGCGSNNLATEPVNRVSRFELRDNTVLTPTETILIDDIHSTNGNHNGGDLQFGKDGHLYVSVGDAGCDYKGDSGCAGSNDAARDRNVLLGKILRITRDGDIPADNPFTGANTARCNVSGGAPEGQTCREIFATGLRNPYRIAFDPNASDTRFFINDVGQNRREEISLGKPGADYGWNQREGNCDRNSDANCNNPPPGLSDPVHTYTREQGCVSITAGAFVPSGIWPAAYDGTYLFADYGCRDIFRLRPSGEQFVATSDLVFNNAGTVIAMRFGPFAGSQALYYTRYDNGGEVRRLSYASTNRPPLASVSATPLSGDAPLRVTFSGQGSSDPDGGALSYSWSFGDGGGGTGITTTHSYTRTGLFTATLTVRDTGGLSATAQLRIDVGNTPPTPQILSPSPALRFRVGQTIVLSGTASDRQDSSPPRLSWEVLLHHITPENSHTHPILQPTEAASVTISAPLPEDIAAAAQGFLEVRLTATDSGGLATVITQELRPNLVPLRFLSDPPGRSFSVNEQSITTPATISTWEGHPLRVTAQSGLDSSGALLTFARWTDSITATGERMIVAPASAISYTAVYSTVLPDNMRRTWLPFVCRLS